MKIREICSARLPGVVLGAAVLATVFLYSVWLTLDTRYPSVDNAQMFTLTLEIYATLKYLGLKSALAYAYFHKHWRPVIFPLVATPFLILTGGKIMFALRIFTCLMLFLNIFIVLKYLRLHGPSIIAAFTFIFFFLAHPFAVTVGNFGSETFLISGFLGLFYVWWKSRGRLEDARSYFLFMILWSWTCLCRPVEGLMLGMPLFLATLVMWKRERSISRPEVVATAVLSLAGIFTLVAPSLFLLREWTPLEAACILILYTCLALFFLWQNKNRTRYFAGFLVFLTPLQFWYVTGAYTLWGWVYETSFGQLAKDTGGTTAKSYYEYWQTLGWNLGYAMVGFISLGLLLIFSKALYPRLQNRRFLLWVSAYLFLNCLLFSFSFNWDHRYIFANILALVLLCGKVIAEFYADTTQWKKRAILGFLSLLAVFLLADWWRLLTEKGPPQHLKFLYAGAHFSRPGTGSALYKLKAALFKYIPEENAQIGVIWQTSPALKLVNGWTLQMLCWDSGKTWVVKNIMFADQSIFFPDKTKLFDMYQYILAGPIEQDLRKFPGTQMTERWLVANCALHGCMDEGLEFVATISTDSGNPEPYTYYLIKNRKYRPRMFPEGFE